MVNKHVTSFRWIKYTTSERLDQGICTSYNVQHWDQLEIRTCNDKPSLKLIWFILDCSSKFDPKHVRRWSRYWLSRMCWIGRSQIVQSKEKVVFSIFSWVRVHFSRPAESIIVFLHTAYWHMWWPKALFLKRDSVRMAGLWSEIPWIFLKKFTYYQLIQFIKY